MTQSGRVSVALHYGGLIGGSPAMRALYAEIEQASRSTAPTLINGESGSGKELVAKEIHARGDRRKEPFLSENCAALSESLLESELFGHVKGAFTGATSDHPGLFLRAGEGTLFLDEVGDMPPAMQSKLLRVLQEGKIRPVGSDEAIPIACRVLAATHRNLRAMAERGDFRWDLYYRLDVLRIRVPPLRERAEDVPTLFAHFLALAGKPGLKLSSNALRLLTGYSWRGNVRELENEARRIASMGFKTISTRQLSEEIRAGRGLSKSGGNYAGKTLPEVEQEMVLAAMKESGGNKARAARQLGIPKTTLYHLLERYGLGS